jgi:hypothetical protein
MSFEKKLGIDSSKKRWLGLKIATISFLICAFGAVIAWLGRIEIGRVVIILGMIGGFAGMAVHFYAFVITRAGTRPETDKDDW